VAIALAVELILVDALTPHVLNVEEGKCVLEAPDVNSTNWAEYHLCHPRKSSHIVTLFVLCGPLKCLYCGMYLAII